MSIPRESSRRPIVVIDGPAGAGKSSVAREVARRLGLPMLDTGALYRSVALAARRRGIAWDDEAALARLAEGLDVRFEPTADGGRRVLLEGDDVTEAIRTPEISDGASQVSALPGVRRALLDLQRDLGSRGCVAEGRDMGTVVFPDADVKFFLTADLATRARRRRDQLEADGRAAPPLEELEASIARRDERDANRAVAPLRPAPDAIVLDTSRAGFEEVVQQVMAHIAQCCPGLVGVSDAGA
ncbi:MAG: (d)CMP kinase [Deltaproteobacteria bacterium]|nr:MAG: (d)CMP kinase [Deltaproteobacteria bacterium]